MRFFEKIVNLQTFKSKFWIMLTSTSPDEDPGDSQPMLSPTFDKPAAAPIATATVPETGTIRTNQLNSELECLVLGYLRLYVEMDSEVDLNQTIPEAVKLLMTKYYGTSWMGDRSMLRKAEMSYLSSMLYTRLRTNNPFYLQLLYRSTRDGSNSLAFHSKCDGIPNTVTLIQSLNGHVFGGFTRIPWSIEVCSLSRFGCCLVT